MLCDDSPVKCTLTASSGNSLRSKISRVNQPFWAERQRPRLAYWKWLIGENAMANYFIRSIWTAGIVATVVAFVGARPGTAAVKMIGDFEANMASPYSNPAAVTWQT